MTQDDVSDDSGDFFMVATSIQGPPLVIQGNLSQIPGDYTVLCAAHRLGAKQLRTFIHMTKLPVVCSKNIFR